MKNLNKEKYIKDLTTLVSFKSITGNEIENSKAIDFVIKQINESAIIERIKNNKTEILLTSNNKTINPDVCYMVHIDVVAAKSEMFTLKKIGNNLFGRGVSDMKFSIPMGYELLNDLIRNNSKLKFMFVITTDEEIGGSDGAGFLATKYGLKPKILIIPDGGDNLVFVNKSKGVCQLRVRSVGKSAHASRIWQGKNAIESLVRLSSKLLDKYENNNKTESWKTTFNIGKINGGESINQVCNEAEIYYDFRFPETTTAENIAKEVSNIAAEISPNLNVEIYSSGNPTYVDEKNSVVVSFVKTFEQVFKRKIKITCTYGASDASHFGFLNVPVLMIKPIGGEIHSNNESINLNSCLKYYNALCKFINKIKENE